MNVLVTGGCGYIGSHMVRMLLKEGHTVTIFDKEHVAAPMLLNMVEVASEEAVSFYGCDVGDSRFVKHLLAEKQIKAVFHFAGRISIAESVANPRLYYRDNLAAGIALLDSCLDVGIKKFIFSSSAAVYGWPQRDVTVGEVGFPPIAEDHRLWPMSAYGESKLIFENILERYGVAYGLRAVSLRYFNAAGAAEGLAERHEPETHLIPLALDAARDGEPLTIHGTDYPTPDGTAVRDYIHVTDLCDGHLAALEHLRDGGANTAVNLGSGVGHSVREVVDTVVKVTGREVDVRYGPRRDGDPPALVANIDEARAIFGWSPKHSSIEEIVRDAWASRK